MTLKNTWWRGGPKEGSKNFFKRFMWSWVVLTLMGWLLLLTGTWLQTTSDEEQNKINVALISMDTFLQNTIDGINYVTQDMPVNAVEQILNGMDSIENLCNDVIQTASDNCIAGVNFLADSTQNTVNQAIIWANDETGGAASVTPISIPDLSVSPFNLSDYEWRPSLDETELEDALSTIQIPDLDFSFEAKVGPFVKDVFDVTRLIASYLIAIGIVLVVYVCLKAFVALIDAYVPRYEGSKGASLKKCAMLCLKCAFLTAQGIVQAIEVLILPWIHIPIIVGLLMVLVVKLWVQDQVEYIQVQIHVPLQDADQWISGVIGDINDVTEGLPVLVADWINTEKNYVEEEAILAVRYLLDNYVLSALNQGLDEVKSLINDLVTELGMSPVEFATLDPNNLGIKIPQAFVPDFPVLDLSSLVINAKDVSLDAAIGPWVDKRVQQVEDVLTVIFWTGLIIFLIPALYVVAVGLKPFVPHSIIVFFENPNFTEEEDDSPPAGKGNKVADTTDADGTEKDANQTPEPSPEKLPPPRTPPAAPMAQKPGLPRTPPPPPPSRPPPAPREE